MKRTLLFLLCTAMSMACYAGFGIRLSGGISLAIPDNKQFVILDQKVKPSYAFSAKLYYDILKLEIGLAADVMKLTTTIGNGGKGVYADPGVPIYVFLNKKHRFIKSDIYYGLAVGYMFSRTDNGKESHTDYAIPNNSGVTAGIQLGGNINITKRFGINVEAGARYAKLGYVAKPDPNQPGVVSDEKVHLNMYYFPILVGLRFEM